MPLDIRPEGRFDRIPAGSILTVHVTPDAGTTNLNATGRLDRPDGSNDDWTHADIVLGTRSVVLTSAGLYQARVSAVVSSATTQEADVDFSIESAGGAHLGTFSATFKGAMVGTDPFISRAKLIINVI
jgi:hypothetical protein